MRQVNAYFALPLAALASSPVVVINILLSNTTVGDPPNANAFVGTVTVVTADGRPYTGVLVLGGTSAIDFVLTNGGVLPCNLLVGSVDIADGTYNINITST